MTNCYNLELDFVHQNLKQFIQLLARTYQFDNSYSCLRAYTDLNLQWHQTADNCLNALWLITAFKHKIKLCRDGFRRQEYLHILLSSLYTDHLQTLLLHKWTDYLLARRPSLIRHH